MNLIDIKSKTLYHKFVKIHTGNNDKDINNFLFWLLKLYYLYLGMINSLAFSSDGKYLATGSGGYFDFI